MTCQLSLLQRDWCERTASAISGAFAPGETFTSDMVREKHLVEEPEHGNWWGVALARLKNMGRIERIGYVTSTREEANGRPVALWRVKG